MLDVLGLIVGSCVGLLENGRGHKILLGMMESNFSGRRMEGYVVERALFGFLRTALTAALQLFSLQIAEPH